MRASSIRVLAAVLAGAAAGASGAAAQDWHRGAFSYEKGPHGFGPHCEYRIIANGDAPVTLLGGEQALRRVEARAVKDWEGEVLRLFGLPYANWEHAAAKVVSCRMTGNNFHCVAAANPCKAHS